MFEGQHSISGRRPLGHRLLRSLLIALLLNGSCTVNAAGKSKSGKKMNTPVMPLDHQKNLEKINELSYRTPFQYHYCPWVTRKLILTLNMTTTNTQYFSLDQLNAVNSDDLEYDYKCDEPTTLRRKPPPLPHSIDSEDFKGANNLNCYERAFLQEIVRRQGDKTKNHWTNCAEFNKDAINEVCKRADETAEKLSGKDVNEKAAHDELRAIFDNYSLKHCNKFELKDVISPMNRKRLLKQIAYNGTCEDVLSEIVKLDALVNFFSCEFDQILSRIYCQGYSVKETCDECSIAYKQWLCSMMLPYYFEDRLIKPCLSICQRVERTCPYLHPEMKDQYGGEPIFICNDPDIPVANNSTDEPYGKDRACFQKCHLEANHTLTMKSLLFKPSQINATEEPDLQSENEEALHENPDLEICIPRENILKNLKQNRKSYDDNETLEQKERLKNATKNEKSSNQSKRDLYAKWSMADGYNSARMVDQIELEEEEIVEEVNKESTLEEGGKHQVDDIYYLDGNNSLSGEGTSNQTNGSSSPAEEQQQQFKPSKQNEQQKFHLDHQRQEANFHFSEDDENDNEEGDSDLDQVISTTTITSLNYAVNKQQQQHLDKKQ